MFDMSHLNCFLYHLFLSHLRRMKVLTTDFLVFFWLKYSNSIMIRLPMSVMSHPTFFIYLIFSVSQTYSKKPNFLMFVIFLLTQPSAIFARCGLLSATDMIAPSCCPLPSQSLPPPAPPLPSPPPASTIEAAHRWCALPHPIPQLLSAATVPSCCAPSPPPPPLPSSTIEAAHRQCALPHLTP